MTRMHSSKDAYRPLVGRISQHALLRVGCTWYWGVYQFYIYLYLVPKSASLHKMYFTGGCNFDVRGLVPGPGGGVLGPGGYLPRYPPLREQNDRQV